MAIELMNLPYEKDALEPWMSRQTLDFHHDKHHKKYVDTLNELIKGTAYEKLSLEEIIQSSFENEKEKKIFNNAGQTWNHNFFWKCLTPTSHAPEKDTADLISKSFGGMEEFKKQFTKVATDLFGSGWAWLIHDGNQLVIEGMSNAGTPVAEGRSAILTCDVWEHAYYLDYQNQRPGYLESFWNLVNWDFVTEQIEGAVSKPRSQSSRLSSHSAPLQ